MTAGKRIHLQQGWTWLAVLISVAAVGNARAQSNLGPGEFLWREPILGKAWVPVSGNDLPGLNSLPPAKSPRVRLFRMPTGFLADPLGLDGNDDFDANDASKTTGETAAGDSGPIQVSMGKDNPYFDYRRAADPGGYGFYKVHSQVQLMDVGPTCFSLGLDAITPAGVQSGGLENGPTVLSPSLAWFQELGEGAAIQGFVGKHIRARSGWSDGLDSDFQYGMAIHCPFPGLCSDLNRGLHVFVQAMGRYRYEGENMPGRLMTWEIIPGFHWRLGEKWWLTIGAARRSHITCLWQF